MGLFSSSWKYRAFAASSPVIEPDDHPETFLKVMFEGLSADDSFGNILRYTITTDMYARSKSMVRYATRESDPYIRGLPTSDLTTFNIEKAWVEGAILREIKMPLVDYFWMKHGIFDAHYVGCKFIHDNYMDIEYFPWPDGCLPDIKNPNFDDGLEHWIPTDFQHNAAERVAELTTDGGTLFSDQVGNVTPGQIISLRAVCCRGSDDPAQTGSINITFYDDEEVEISTVSAANTTTPGDEWELLTVITTVPTGAVTAKAWAGGAMVVDTRRTCVEIKPESSQAYAAYAIINFYPWRSYFPPGINPGTEFSYPSGVLPGSNDWYWAGTYSDTEIDGSDQAYIKVSVDQVLSGTSTVQLTENDGALDAWHDIWDDEWVVELWHEAYNGVPEHQNVTVSIAKSDGAGAPDLDTVINHKFEMWAYKGKKEYKIEDSFDANTGSLENHPPNLDRRAYDGGSFTEDWVDAFYDYYGTTDYGWITVTSSPQEAKSSGPGDVTNEALYLIDSDITDCRVIAGCIMDANVAGGIVARAQDHQNFWLLAVKNPSATDPVLGIYKVSGGTHTLAASTTLTGLGPLTGVNDTYPLRLTCDEDKITGEIAFMDSSVAQKVSAEPRVTVTDAAFNTATDVGLWADDTGFIWENFLVYPWPPGATDWDIFVWNDTPDSGSSTGCGDNYAHFYIYSNSNGKTAHPYHASYAFTNSNTPFPSWLNWRLTQADTDTFLVQFEALSGDTDQIILAEYGQFANAGDWGDWMDPYNFIVYLLAPESTSKTATFRARFGIAEPGGSFGNRTLMAGTESVWKTITLTSTSTGPC
jgi:hypothetical protein